MEGNKSDTEENQINQQLANGNDSAEENEEFGKEDLQCRFYRNEWPEVNEVVVVSLHHPSDGRI